MSLPEYIKEKIEKEIQNTNIKEIKKNAKEVSQKYRENNGTGSATINSKNEIISYCLTRMPATYEVVRFVLNQIDIKELENVKTVIDVGAGIGSASIVIEEIMPNAIKIDCYEKEEEMINLGKTFVQNANWEKCDIEKQEITQKADMVITSYMINELKSENIEQVVNKLWKAAEKFLIIIEPGTKKGFENIKKAKEIVKEQGGYIIAPCFGNIECQLEKEDWCHFSTRVQRSKLHKDAKGGVAPFEDEKFSYFIACKEENICKKIENSARVLRHPKINSGFVNLKICNQGKIEDIIISKKNKELFKIARKIKNGESFKYN